LGTIYAYDRSPITIFEQTFQQEMSLDQIKRFKKICDNTNLTEKHYFYIYRSCLKPYGTDTFMKWLSVEKSDLDKWINHKIGVKNTIVQI
jgi:hypothetical protein